MEASKRKIREIVKPQIFSTVLAYSAGNTSDSRSRKSLFREHQSREDAVPYRLNVDDLDTTTGYQTKVVVAFLSGNIVVKSNFDDEVKSLMTNVCYTRLGTTVGTLFRPKKLLLMVIK